MLRTLQLDINLFLRKSESEQHGYDLHEIDNLFVSLGFKVSDMRYGNSKQRVEAVVHKPQGFHVDNYCLIAR